MTDHITEIERSRDLGEGTNEAIRQLIRHGNAVEHELILDVLEDLTEINGNFAHGEDISCILLSINNIRKTLIKMETELNPKTRWYVL